MKKAKSENSAKILTTAISALMLISLISVFQVGAASASPEKLLEMKGGSLSVTSESGAYPEETVLDDVAFNAQSGLVTIEGTIFDLDVASGGWPDTAYLEIGVRPEATKGETNAGVYMIVLASAQSGTLAIHLQDYGGQRPPCPPWPAYIDTEKAKEGVRYKITLIPSSDFGGTAYLELWDADETYYEAPSLEYGYSDANTLDEDFSEAHLFYSIMVDATGVPDITYSATVGDITVSLEVWVDDDAEKTWYDDPAHFATIQEGIDAVAEGGTVIVHPGTYREIVLIDKSLTLQGMDRDTTIITDEGAGYSGITNYATIGVGVNNVTISGFTIMATEGAEVGASRTIHVSSWFNRHYPGQGFSAVPSNIEISNNNIFYPSTGKKTGIGMYVTENVTIVGNTIVGEESGVGKGIGIYIDYQEYGGDRNNYGSGYTIENNTISGGSIGMSLGCITDFTISRNNVSGMSCDLGGGDTNHGAIEVWYSYNGTIERNTVTNNEKGIAVWSDPGGDENVGVHYNNIVGNTTGLIASSNVSKTVNATLNWWGRPDIVGIIKGTKGNINADPWLDAPYPYGNPVTSKGEKGDKGDQGLLGEDGEKGDTGNTGATGATGATGPEGEAGLAGSPGPKGDKGDTGAMGSQGLAGPAGAAETVPLGISVFALVIVVLVFAYVIRRTPRK